MSLSLSMCIYIYIYTLYVCIHISIYTSLSLSIYIYIYICAPCQRERHGRALLAAGARCVTWGFLLCLSVLMKSYSEIFVSKRYDFGCNFWDREGRKESYTQTCTV